MFHSQSLSRKGPLASVWVAAYCHKRLKKSQVTATDIPFSVDKILQDEFEIITYRVLGYFLLGVVRIYSKKVEYLFNDCHKVLIEVKGFVVGEGSRSRAPKVVSEPVSFITRPRSFELDAFDLGEVEEDANGAHQKSQEEITLKDNSWRHAGMGQYVMQQYNWEEVAGSQDTCSTDYTEAEDVVPLAIVYAEPEASMERPQETMFSQELPVGLLTFEDHQDRSLDEDHQGEWEEMRDPEAAPLSEKDKCHCEDEEFNLSNLDATMERLQEDGNLEIDKESFKVVAACDGDKRFVNEEERHLSNLEMTNEKLREDEGFEKGDTDLEMAAPLDGETQELTGNDIEVDFAPEVDAAFDGHKCLVGEEERNLRDLGTRIEKLREDGTFQKADADLEMLAPEDGETRLTSTESKADFSPKETDKPSEIVSCDSPEPDVVMTDPPISLTVYSTPVAKLPNTAEVAGGPTPDFILVPTPALKERRKTKRKRKCLVDDLIVLPNELIKKSLRDASDLVCKRRKAPRDAFSAWKATRRLGFEEPLIPYSSPELRSLHFAKNLKISAPHEEVEISAPCEDVEISVVHEDAEILVAREDVEISAPREDVEIPGPCKVVEVPEVKVLEPPCVDGSSEQAGIAPETPTQQFSSRRSFESPRASKSDEMRPESPLKSVALEKEPSVYEDQDLSSTLMNEDLTSSEGESHEPYGWTGRTRTVAQHLNKVFQKLKGEGEAASLLQISERRTRKESARLFYEILVLKSNGFIDVNQQTPHSDVLIRKVPKLEQAFNAEDPKSCA